MMSNLPWRVLGVLLLGLCVVFYEPTAPTALHRLLLPLGMAVATWLMVQNLAAVALGTALLAGIHSEPGSPDPIAGIGYPTVAAAAGLLLLAILAQRFRARIRATHAERWESRRSGRNSATAPNQEGTSR